MNLKLEILKTNSVNLAAIGVSLTEWEQFLRVGVLLFSLGYTFVQFRKALDDKPKGKK
jgi:hypothetical protein